MKQISGIVVIVILFISCTATKKLSTIPFRPEGITPEPHITLSAGDLTVTFVDNSAFGEHRAGYNGIASLIHKNEASSPFVPLYAGFNLEHIFGGDSLVQLFEPRRHPMQLFRKSAKEVVLYQEATPLSGVESSTTFKLVEPHYIDIQFRCRFTNVDFFKHGYAGLFWASYINEPADKGIHFWGAKGAKAPGWVTVYSPEHGVESTHRSVSDTANLYYAPNFNAKLSSNLSDYNFLYPYYFGKYKEMVFAYLLNHGKDSEIRFSQSPTGGGEKNPAWDFHFIIKKPKINSLYFFESRVLYKPFSGEEDVKKEFETWMDTQPIP